MEEMCDKCATTPVDVIVRAVIPDADDALVSHILWGRTHFPFAPLSARDIYEAADRFNRMTKKGLQPCDFCDRLAMPGKWLCKLCDEALSSARAERLEKENARSSQS